MDDNQNHHYTEKAVAAAAVVAAGAYVAMYVNAQRKKRTRTIKACVANAQQSLMDLVATKPNLTHRDVTEAFMMEMEFLNIVKNYQRK